MSVICQEHLAHDTVERLGQLGSVQFTDLNGDLTAFRRAYTPFVKRCDELEKKLRFFEAEMRVHALALAPVSQGEFNSWHSTQLDAVKRDHPGMTLLDYWEAVVAERFRDYNEVKAQRDRTAATVYQAVQRRFVIEKAAEFFAVERDALGAGAEAGAGAGAGVAAGGSNASSVGIAHCYWVDTAGSSNNTFLGDVRVALGKVHGGFLVTVSSSSLFRLLVHPTFK